MFERADVKPPSARPGRRSPPRKSGRAAPDACPGSRPSRRVSSFETGLRDAIPSASPGQALPDRSSAPSQDGGVCRRRNFSFIPRRRTPGPSRRTGSGAERRRIGRRGPRGVRFPAAGASGNSTVFAVAVPVIAPPGNRKIPTPRVNALFVPHSGNIQEPRRFQRAIPGEGGVKSGGVLRISRVTVSRTGNNGSISGSRRYFLELSGKRAVSSVSGRDGPEVRPAVRSSYGAS